MEEPGATPHWYLGLVLGELSRVVAALPESVRPDSNPYGFPWELVICAVVHGFFCRSLFFFRSVRSRLYVGREKKLAVTLSGLIEEKRKLLEKFSHVQKEYEGYEVESSLKNASFEKEATCEKLNRSNSELEDEILLAEVKMNLTIFQMNEERLKIAIKDALNENSQLQENEKQLLQEAEVWKEQVSELNKQKITFEDSKVHAEQVLNDKENHIKTLNAAMLGEDITDDGNLELEMNSESENGQGIKLVFLELSVTTDPL
uniref:Uncharacterized protein n=1 Tax=Gorilla gorilla gorilla TaxID=9595 RepID=A0A2I2ZXL0_GORGO